jgi:hypothetical protein
MERSITILLYWRQGISNNHYYVFVVGNDSQNTRLQLHARFLFAYCGFQQWIADFKCMERTVTLEQPLSWNTIHSMTACRRIWGNWETSVSQCPNKRS